MNGWLLGDRRGAGAVIDSLVGELAHYEAMAELKIGDEADRAVARTLATQIRCLLLSLSHEAANSSRAAITSSTDLLLATCLAMQDSTVRLEEGAGLLDSRDRGGAAPRPIGARQNAADQATAQPRRILVPERYDPLAWRQSKNDI